MYKYLSEEFADLTTVEADVTEARQMGMKLSAKVMSRLTIWMIDARMRVNDYETQASYLSSPELFNLDRDSATDVATNALENSLSRLITLLIPEMLESDSAPVTTLRFCLRPYVSRGVFTQAKQNATRND